MYLLKDAYRKKLIFSLEFLLATELVFYGKMKNSGASYNNFLEVEICNLNCSIFGR